MIPKIKSPLRYPGGKSRALKEILPIIPDFEEFREPMVGGGSVFFALKQLYPEKIFWINDINEELYHFYKSYKEDSQRLITKIKTIKRKRPNGRILYSKISKNDKNLKGLHRAARFFILNRITFSGLAEAGGYSDEAFVKRFTDSSIKRLADAAQLLKGVSITNTDYSEVIKKEGENVFIFLDPPYYSNSGSKLYGRRGCYHEGFDHEKFANDMRNCPHKWLITYDDTPEVRKLFPFAFIYEWKLQYAMDNHNGKNPSMGKELFICNFEIPLSSQKLFVQIQRPLAQKITNPLLIIRNK